MTPLSHYHKRNSDSHFNSSPQFIENHNHPAKLVQVLIEDFGDPELPIIVPTASIQCDYIFPIAWVPCGCLPINDNHCPVALTNNVFPLEITVSENRVVVLDCHRKDPCVVFGLVIVVVCLPILFNNGVEHLPFRVEWAWKDPPKPFVVGPKHRVIERLSPKTPEVAMRGYLTQLFKALAQMAGHIALGCRIEGAPARLQWLSGYILHDDVHGRPFLALLVVRIERVECWHRYSRILSDEQHVLAFFHVNIHSILDDEMRPNTDDATAGACFEYILRCGDLFDCRQRGRQDIRGCEEWMRWRSIVGIHCLPLRTGNARRRLLSAKFGWVGKSNSARFDRNQVSKAGSKGFRGKPRAFKGEWFLPGQTLGKNNWPSFNLNQCSD